MTKSEIARQLTDIATDTETAPYTRVWALTVLLKIADAIDTRELEATEKLENLLRKAGVMV